ncbi:MAG: hypothetical protein HY925_05415, partial [Elusimicrobia bacterium]|nr:hypothetical protein [Elusimicrobiota bacterium]
MGKKPQAPPPPLVPPALTFLWTALWVLAFAALAWAPDEKLVRHKLMLLDASLAGLVLSLAAAAVAGAWTRRTRTPLDGAVLAYAAAGLAFFALSPERGVSLPELTRTLFASAVFFAAAQTLPFVEPKAVLAAWTATAALIALYALLQLRGGLGPLLLPQDARPFATFGNPIFLGAYLSASACAAAGLGASVSARARAL